MSQQDPIIKIIVTDDQLLFRRGIKTSLADKKDVEIIGEAENGLDLLQRLEYLQPDIIILNIHMPVMNGVETLPILKQRYPGIKVIILSMNNDPGMIYRMMDLGANAYLTKDTSSNEIYEAIKDCHTKGFFVRNILKKYLLTETQESSVDFTSKEIQTLKLLSEGKGTSEIAKEFDLTTRTVDAIIGKLKTKSGAKSLDGLIDYARGKKII